MFSSNFISSSVKFISTFNLFIPSLLAVANIVFISKMYHTVIAQNVKIVEMLLASRQETSTKIIPALPDPAILSQEATIWNNIMPYAIFFGSIAIVGLSLYFYYYSGSGGPSPDFTSIGTNKIEEVITRKIDEKSTEILESIGQKSTEVISVVVDKTSNNATESFINGGFNYILASVSQQMKGNNNEMSKVISKVTDDSNSATIDLINSLTTDLGKKMDSNHVELSSMYSSLSAQIDELKQLIINSIGS